MKPPAGRLEKSLNAWHEELVGFTGGERHDHRLVFTPVEAGHLADASVGHANAIVTHDSCYVVESICGERCDGGRAVVVRS